MSRFIVLVVVCSIFSSSTLVNAEESWKGGGALFEDFSAGWDTRWTHSKAAKYDGKFTAVKPAGWSENGIKISQKSQHYGLFAPLSPALDPSEGLVVQYEVKYAEGVTCGGAYLKLISDGADLDGVSLDNDTPYSIMFGPDKCGVSSKVHLIFRHRNPKTGTITEKHLKNPPAPITDEATHVYTLKLAPDNKFEVLIDGEVKASGSLLGDAFDPGFSTPKEIPDPDDQKPSDWVDDAKISDPAATKPADWVEEQEIDDPKAKKPSGWLDDEPEVINDPGAKKPDDWDEEEDGDWTAPEIPNPKCKKAGCGVWKPPRISNPAYKGPWTAPMIDNPEYKGPWIQKKIANPEYYEEKEPLKNIGKIAAVAFELWTIDQGYTFDNVYVGQDAAAAKELRAELWRPKFQEEKKFLKSDDEDTPRADQGLGKMISGLFSSEPLSKYKQLAAPVLDFLEENEWAAWVLVGSPILLLFSTIFYCLVSKKPAKPDAVGLRKKDLLPEEEDDAVEPEEEEHEDKDEDATTAAPEPSVVTTRTAAKSTKTGEIQGDDSDDDDDAKGPRRRRA